MKHVNPIRILTYTGDTNITICYYLNLILSVRYFIFLKTKVADYQA